MRDVTISVVIPTYNEEKCIENCLSSVMNGSALPLEIIVADGGSSDKTVEIAKRMGAIVINNPHKHAAGGRNEGIKIAKGNVIAFIDADCIADKYWLQEIKNTFDERSSRKHTKHDQGSSLLFYAIIKFCVMQVDLNSKLSF